jgi:hypothetical protein
MAFDLLIYYESNANSFLDENENIGGGSSVEVLDEEVSIIPIPKSTLLILFVRNEWI